MWPCGGKYVPGSGLQDFIPSPTFSLLSAVNVNSQFPAPAPAAMPLCHDGLLSLWDH